MIDKSDLVRRLVSEFSYSLVGAQTLAAKLEASGPQIRTALDFLMTTGKVPDLVVDGYSIDRLAREHGMNAFAALLTLDWLIREPERASRSLQKGHDSVRLQKPTK